jgi:hypothetical protein
MPEDSVRHVRDLLPNKFEHMDEAVRRAVSDDAELSGANLPGFFAGLVCERAADFVGSVLDCDAFELLAQAWVKAVEIRALAQQSKGSGEKPLDLFLGEHEAVSTSHPVVEVTVARLGRVSIRFTLELAARVHEAKLVFVDGRLVELGGCNATVSAQLKYKDLALHKKLEPRGVETPGFRLKSPGLALA